MSTARTLILLGSITLQGKDDPADLVKAYAKLDLDSMAKSERSEIVFDDACKDRIDLETRLVACGSAAVKPLVGALKSDNRHVRAMAAELLGILADKSAGPALVDAAKDSDPTVRIYAIQSLAWLKFSPETVKAAAKDTNKNVQFVAQRALEQLQADLKLKDAFARVKRDELGSAEVGKKAPDFTLPTADGKEWKLSNQKGLVVLMFQLADW